ncbi:hypothetical protein [Lacinutrix salivirga]
MDNLKQQLEIYIKEKEELKGRLFDRGFKSSEELNQFKIENIDDFNKYYFLFEEVRKLEWELLTPDKRAEKEEQRRMSKLKREGKL